MGSPEFDEFGTKMLYLTTGQFVDVKVGKNPSKQGQRYNVDHKFKNYMQIGYLKTAKGQKVIEMKTDGHAMVVMDTQRQYLSVCGMSHT